MRLIYLMDQMYLHGGAEKILSLKINALIQHYNHEVFLITLNQNKKKFVYNLSSQINHIDLNINYNTKRSYFHSYNLFKSLKHYLKLKKVINRISPQVIISVSQTPDQFFLPYIISKTPIIKEFHSSGYNRKLGKIKSKLFSIYNKYSSLVILNKDEKKYYPFNNLTIIPNFTEHYPRELNSEQFIDKKIIIAAGRIAQVKQFDHLITIWNTLEKKFPEWQIHIYGDGDEVLKQKLKKKIEHFSLNNIKLKGATKNLKQKMEQASIFALTSQTECFPMVLLEAMANDLAIVSYDCPHGPRNIINNECGILVAQNDINAFVREIERLMLDNNLRTKMIKNGRLCVQHFSEKEIVKKWNELFNKLIEK